MEPKWRNQWMIGRAQAHEVPAESIAHYRETVKTRFMSQFDARREFRVHPCPR